MEKLNREVIIWKTFPLSISRQISITNDFLKYFLVQFSIEIKETYAWNCIKI